MAYRSGRVPVAAAGLFHDWLDRRWLATVRNIYVTLLPIDKIVV